MEDSDPGTDVDVGMPNAPLAIAAYTLTNALGAGRARSMSALREMRPGLRPCGLPDVALDTWVGMVEGLEGEPLGGELAPFDCRNHRLAALAMDQDGFRDRVAEAARRHGAGRIGVFVGTSTSGLRHTEARYRERYARGAPGLDADLRFAYTHTMGSSAAFCRRFLGLHGPAVAISTACSSSAKVFAAAQRSIACGLCDAAVVGGVDTLCATTLYGFHALGLVSSRPCRPWGLGRDGLSIGEGAAFALVERRQRDDGRLALLGCGESSDAHHISAPHPQGEGAALAMSAALASADMEAGDIDCINLHGTGTPANDQAEDLAVARVFGPGSCASATKGWTGHTLGAAGATEAVLCLLCLEAGLVPGTLNTDLPDPTLALQVRQVSQAGTPRRMLTNSFGFGGSNCSLILGWP
jgi:3-oxoacyl-[acyl-carrier-protein] synthase-1